MLQIPIPGFKALDLHHLVLDFNGTLSYHGALIEDVGERLESLAVCGGEGVAREAMAAADLFIPWIQDALDLLRHPQRLVATLRS